MKSAILAHRHSTISMAKLQKEMNARKARSWGWGNLPYARRRKPGRLHQKTSRYIWESSARARHVLIKICAKEPLIPFQSETKPLFKSVIPLSFQSTTLWRTIWSPIRLWLFFLQIKVCVFHFAPPYGQSYSTLHSPSKPARGIQHFWPQLTESASLIQIRPEMWSNPEPLKSNLPPPKNINIGCRKAAIVIAWKAWPLLAMIQLKIYL